MELYRRGKVYWVAFYVDGRRYRRSTQERTRTAAGLAAAALQIGIKEGHGLKKRRVPTLWEFTKDYLAHEQQRAAAGQIAPKSLRYYEYGCSLLLKQPYARQPLDRIGTMDVSQTVVPGGPATLNTALRTLRRLLSVAVEEGLIRRERADGQMRFPKIALAREKGREEVITSSDDGLISAILTAPRAGRPFGAIVSAWALHVDAGMRPCEVVSLRVQDLDFAAETMTISKSKTSAGLRKVPMTRRVYEALAKQIGDRQTGWVYPSPKREGEHIGASTLTKAFAAARRRAMLPSAKKLYSTRHAFGTDLMRITGDPYLVMEVMGHSNLASGKPYQHKKTEIAARAFKVRAEEKRAEQEGKTLQ